MTELARILTSPKSLLVFEAAARHGSFTRAAKDFNISQPSISRNIAQLEEDIGLPLFVRGAGGAQLTDAGRLLFAATTDGLGRILDAVNTLRAQSMGIESEVVLSLSNAFVTNWLASRLAALSEAFPEAVLRFDLLPGTRKSVAGEVDLATLISDPTPGGIILAPEVIVPVCSPEYLAGHGGALLEHPAEGWAGHTFLHLTDHPRQIWDPILGADSSARGQAVWHTFSDYAAIVQAATDGTGVALGWLNVVAGSLRSGRLVPAWQGRWIETGRVIRLLSTRPGPMRPVAVEIAQWLCDRMAEDLQAVARLGAGPEVLDDGTANAADSVNPGPYSVE